MLYQISLPYEKIYNWLPQTIEKLFQNIQSNLTHPKLNKLNKKNISDNNHCLLNEKSKFNPYIESNDTSDTLTEDLLSSLHWSFCVKADIPKHKIQSFKNKEHLIHSNFNKFIPSNATDLELDDVKKLLKERNVECYIRVQYDKLTVRSKKINYANYQNQQVVKNKKPKAFNLEHIKKLINTEDETTLNYLKDTQPMVLKSKEINNKTILIEKSSLDSLENTIHAFSQEISINVLQKSIVHNTYVIREWKIFYVYKDTQSQQMFYVIATESNDITEEFFSVYSLDKSNLLQFKFILNKGVLDILKENCFNVELKFEEHPFVNLSKDNILKNLHVNSLFKTKDIELDLNIVDKQKITKIPFIINYN